MVTSAERQEGARAMYSSRQGLRWFAYIGAVLSVIAGVGMLGAGTGIAAPKATTEMIEGSATITDEPAGWQPSNFYVMLCPDSEPFSVFCAGQDTNVSTNQTTGHYTARAPARAWQVGFYYYTINGQMIPSSGVALPARPGKTIKQNVTMQYVVPAVQGRVRMKGAPQDFNSLAYMGVQACPSTAVFSVGCAGGQEAYEDVGPGLPYLIDLSPGTWEVAGYYMPTNNSKVFSGTPVTLKAEAGTTKTMNVTVHYQGL
jgi:hypothetical protein